MLRQYIALCKYGPGLQGGTQRPELIAIMDCILTSTHQHWHDERSSSSVAYKPHHFVSPWALNFSTRRTSHDRMCSIEMKRSTLSKVKSNLTEFVHRLTCYSEAVWELAITTEETSPLIIGRIERNTKSTIIHIRPRLGLAL